MRAWQVLVVEDDEATREFFADAVRGDGGLALAGCVGTVAEAVAWLDAPHEDLDVLLVDIGLPDGSGLEVIRHALRRDPACEPLVISMFGDEENVLASIEAGAMGYIHKDSSPDDIAGVILEMKRGGSPISPMIARRMRGSFHPLVAVSDPGDLLEGHTAALSATGRPLMAILKRMAEDLGLATIEVPEARRAAYHAGAVLAAGGVVSLLSAAVDALAEAGIDPEAALRALLPLSRSALRGVEQRGLARGLTGPVKRGDLAVVQAHLSALPADLAELYRTLSLRALALCGAQLPIETRNALDRLLRS